MGYIWFSWVLPSNTYFTGFLLDFTNYYQFLRVFLLGFYCFSWILLSFTEFYWNLLDLIRFNYDLR